MRASLHASGPADEIQQLMSSVVEEVESNRFFKLSLDSRYLLVD